MNRFDAFILIGGKSSRLGADKAFIELGGRTLAERAVENVRRGLSPERITMVAGSSTQFATQAIRVEIPFIFDLYEGRGPLGGLHAALAYAQTAWIFLLACDYPFVSPELIGSLAVEVSEEFGAVVPIQSDGRLQPLCAFYNVQRVQPVIEGILTKQRASPPMHEIVASLNPLIISADRYATDVSGNPFTNINKAEDLESARAIEQNNLLSRP